MLGWNRSPRNCLKRLKEIGKGVHVTVGSKGSLVCGPDENPTEVKGFETEVNDTNGAGDMYAAAALSMIVRGFAHVEAARFGNYAAAQIVRQYGARCRPLNIPNDKKSIRQWFVKQIYLSTKKVSL